MARYLGAQCAPQRKFVWDRTFGQFGAGDVGVDLLPPSGVSLVQTHLGATVMRIRGYIVPSEVFDDRRCRCLRYQGRYVEHGRHRPQQPALPAARLRLDGLAPVERVPPDLPSLAPTSPETSTPSEWAVDVKSNRKFEELNETLWLFGDQTGAGERTYFYHLSIGMKLA